MTPYRFASVTFALVLFAAIIPVPQVLAAPAPAEPAAYGQEPWAIPPREFNEIQRRAYLDGIEGARRDYGNHRNPDVNQREEYRNPNIDPSLRDVYRAAFRRGYETAAARWWGTPPPPPPAPVGPPPNQDWDRWGMRGLENDTERRGYHDGIEQAHREVQANRAPDPEATGAFRNPPVPPPLLGDYREGFLRGYEVAISQLTGGTPWEARDNDFDHWAPPDAFTEWQRRGFHDGVEGARHDFGNHRRPSVLNRWEYTSPKVPPEVVHDYREGFRRGYEMAASRLWGM